MAALSALSTCRAVTCEGFARRKMLLGLGLKFVNSKQRKKLLTEDSKY